MANTWGNFIRRADAERRKSEQNNEQAKEESSGPGSPVAGGYAAEELTPGTEVEVDCEYYTGPGAVTDQTKYGAHIMHLGEDYAGENAGPHVAVMIPNGNTHLYPIDAVEMAKREAA